MKKWTSKVKEEAQKFWNDEDAQGMMEYILIAVVVVGIVMLVGPKVKTMISDKADSLGSDLGGVTTDM